MRMLLHHRRIFAQLITQLMKEGKKDKALAALNMPVIPRLQRTLRLQNGALGDGRSLPGWEIRKPIRSSTNWRSLWEYLPGICAAWTTII